MKMLAAVARFLIAAAAAVVLILVVMWATTGRWPAIVTVRNTLENAQCALTFSDGWTWTVALKQGEQKNWFFLLGQPKTVDAVCDVAGRRIVRKHAFCDRVKRPTLEIGEAESDTPDLTYCPR